MHKLIDTSKEKENTIKKPQIMGIINATDDSINNRMLGDIDKMLYTIEDMIKYGVDIIDIGAAPIKSGSEMLPEEIELTRLKEPIKAIYDAGFTKQIKFSIDSYNYKCVKYCIEHGFKYINDIYGCKDNRTLDLFKDYLKDDIDARIISMYNNYDYGLNCGLTLNIENINNFMSMVINCIKNNIDIIMDKGIKKEQIIIDPGYGIGYSADSCAVLINNLNQLKCLNQDILMATSWKVVTNRYINSRNNFINDEKKLGYSLFLANLSLENGASIIRCHNYKEHIAMADAWYHHKISGYINKV